jgi:hypothetical protein
MVLVYPCTTGFETPYSDFSNIFSNINFFSYCTLITLMNTGKGYNRDAKSVPPPGHIPWNFGAYFSTVNEWEVI